MRRRMMGKSDKYPNGVYILRMDGKLYTRSEWSTAWNDEAVGVALKTDNCRFVISLVDYDKTMWSKKGASDKIPGVTSTSDIPTAKTDYKGIENSAAIISFYGAGTDYAAGLCAEHTFKNGQKGYLGACGEWQEAFNNKDEINACMSLVRCDAIAGDEYYWVSTQWSGPFAFVIRWNDEYISAHSKSWEYHLRPFAPLEDNNLI